MNRNIHRQLHLYNSVNILIAEIGHGNIVALQKAQTRIIVLEVQRFTHTLRKLIYEAEHTVILTVLLAVHKICFKIESEILVFAFFNFYLLVLKLNNKLFIRSVELIIQYVVYSVTVYRNKAFSCLNFCFICR